MSDITAFIKTHLTLAPAKGVPEIMLYQAHPKSGLTHFLGEEAPPPYWAYGWAGGNVLAHHLLHSDCLSLHRRVYDVGTGSSIVAIAAAMMGAEVEAIDMDPNAIAAARLNAEANRVHITFHVGDGLSAVPDADLVCMGDLFYDETLAVRSLAFARRCKAVLIGDPGRKPLPHKALKVVASYDVPDFGQSAPAQASVWTLV
jgi:predicted nicotinamide N-methyase